MWFTAVNCLQIFEYHSPLVTFKHGKGWLVDGRFNLVHVINLEEYEHLLDQVVAMLGKVVVDERAKMVIDFHVNTISSQLDTLMGKYRKQKRSINWIGSAWKWLAGNPDAADWDKVLKSEQSIIENNNHQYVINDRLFKASQEAISKVNAMVARFHNEVKETNVEKFINQVIRQIVIIKEEVNEVTRAAQMAKGGIVNSNVLDREEIHRIIDEIATLPYSNELEAIEYANPKVCTNGSMILYVLSLPKVRKAEYNYLIVKPSVREGKVIDIRFNTLLVNEKETYGITEPCMRISNNTVCEEKSLKKLPEDDCISTLIKGGEAKCSYRSCEEEVVELVMEDTIFITNFKGNLQSGNVTKFLSGTYAVRLNNEEVTIKNLTYISRSETSIQILPQIVTTVLEGRRQLDMGYLHNISLQNIKNLERLDKRYHYSIVADCTIFLLLLFLGYLCWKALYSRVHLPPLRSMSISTPKLQSAGRRFLAREELTRASVLEVNSCPQFSADVAHAPTNGN